MLKYIKVTERSNHLSGRDKKWKETVLHKNVGITLCASIATVVAIYMSGVKPDDPQAKCKKI